MSRAYEGTSWRGASGDVATVETVVEGIAYGWWESGNPWQEHVDMLDKLYTRAPAIPETPAGDDSATAS